jgi:hypothetical protein
MELGCFENPFGKTAPHSTSKAQNDYNTLAFLFLVFSYFLLNGDELFSFTCEVSAFFSSYEKN